MIFENPGSQEEAELQEINRRLSGFEKGVLEKETYRDEGRGKTILVVRLSPNKAEEIMQEFLVAGLSKSTAVYYYGARSRDSGGGK